MRSVPFNICFRTYLLVDPNEREERVMDGLLVIAMNKHREICTIQSSGGIMLLPDQVSALTVPLVEGSFQKLCCYFICFQGREDRVSLYNSLSSPGTNSLDQTGRELTEFCLMSAAIKGVWPQGTSDE